VVSWKEVNLYSWKSKGNIITDEPIKLNDDGLDALRYALYSSKKSSGSGVWDYELVFA
jgi:valyl-tRNA synthetase